MNLQYLTELPAKNFSKGDAYVLWEKAKKGEGSLIVTGARQKDSAMFDQYVEKTHNTVFDIVLFDEKQADAVQA